MARMSDVVLLDIEGTTTPISFVFDVLFPYAAQRIPEWLRQHGDEPAGRAACDLVLKDAIDDERRLPRIDAVLAVVRRQMAGDVKAAGLKQLQGLVWEDGYTSGQIKGRVYADVPECLRRWQAAGRRAAIYSSGSVLAQKLLFAHSEHGDLTPLLGAHFDTAVGGKRDAASYRAIAERLGVAPSAVTFATDIPAEAEAAKAAGMGAVVLMRPGNPPLPANLPFAVHADLTKI